MDLDHLKHGHSIYTCVYSSTDYFNNSDLSTSKHIELSCKLELGTCTQEMTQPARLASCSSFFPEVLTVN